jgi:predicted transcriptional regulator
MNKHLFSAVFAFGAMAIVWAGAGFVGSNALALAMTLVIAAVYGFGALELHRFRQASMALSAALEAIPETLTDLGDWLASVPASLRNAVRSRIEGERIGLPGPALTPYLVGLLVMLGMLGTFLGMVMTLNGAVFALEGSSDLASIRAAFAAPIKGLGLAFGTSVAGVAASAMLGLMSALSRRERMLAAQLLDTRIATTLRGFSLTHQRQETFKALQLQSRALPELADKLQTLMSQMERMSLQLNERLLTNQESFHSDVKVVYADLARSVDQSLRDALSQSAQLAGESIKPVVEAAMTGIAQDASLMHERMIAATQGQLEGLSEGFGARAAAVAQTWSAALARHEQSSASLVTGMGQSLTAFSETFEQRSASLLAAVSKTYTDLQLDQASRDSQRLAAWLGSLETMAATLQREWQQGNAQTLAQQQQVCTTLSSTAQAMSEQAQSSASRTLAEIARLITGSEELVRARVATEENWTQQHGERMDQLARLLHDELGALRDGESLRGNAAVDRLGELQAALTRHLTTLGTALEDPITRLIQTASEAPRAAAEVIGQLRREVSSSVARDNELLEERSRIMETLNALLASIHHASAEQRAVIDSLVKSSAVALSQTGSVFSESVGLETAKLSDIAAHVTSSAVDVSSLSESFSFAVRSFGDANEKLIANLQRIESAMDKSMARSDDQLAYYVAQAREIIDLSIMSQKEIVEELRQLPGKQAQLSAEAA